MSCIGIVVCSWVLIWSGAKGCQVFLFAVNGRKKASIFCFCREKFTLIQTQKLKVTYSASKFIRSCSALLLLAKVCWALMEDPVWILKSAPCTLHAVPLSSRWVVLQIRVPWSVRFIRVPPSVGFLKGEPNLKNGYRGLNNQNRVLGPIILSLG